LLKHVELTIDRINDDTDADIDAQRNGGMLTLVFRNGSQIILNLQKPLHEVWMAAKSGGYHYQWRNDAWRENRSGTEFLADLSRDASTQSQQQLGF
jgi:CyaY protein